MIHYNPELHHDKVVAFLQQLELRSECFEPSNTRFRNDGTPICEFYAGGETMTFEYYTLIKLVEEAHGKNLVNPPIFGMDQFTVKPKPYNKKYTLYDMPVETLKISPQGGTSCMHPEHIPYYLRGNLTIKIDYTKKP